MNPEQRPDVTWLQHDNFEDLGPTENSGNVQVETISPGMPILTNSVC